jgi:nitroreductase
MSESGEGRSGATKGKQLIERLVGEISPPDRPGGQRRAVSDAELTALLAAARVAPSADNLQTWRFVVVRAPETRGRLAAAVPSGLAGAVSDARLLLVVCGVRAIVTRVRREQPFVLVDVPISLSHVLLQAAELGLPCAWTLQVDEAVCRRTLAIPEEVRVLALLALG